MVAVKDDWKYTLEPNGELYVTLTLDPEKQLSHATVSVSGTSVNIKNSQNAQRTVTKYIPCPGKKCHFIFGYNSGIC